MNSKGKVGTQLFLRIDHQSSGGGAVVDEAIPVAQTVFEAALSEGTSTSDTASFPSNMSLSLPQSVQISNVNVFLSGGERQSGGVQGDGCRLS